MGARFWRGPWRRRALGLSEVDVVGAVKAMEPKQRSAIATRIFLKREMFRDDKDNDNDNDSDISNAEQL